MIIIGSMITSWVDDGLTMIHFISDYYRGVKGWDSLEQDAKREENGVRNLCLN